MSVANELMEIAGPSGPVVKVRIPRAARLLGWSRSRVFKLWYGQADPTPSEEFQARTVAAEKRARAEAETNEIRTELAAIRAELQRLHERLGS